MSIRLAHIINPFLAPPDSDLLIAQPITFESMRRARDQAKGQVDVELLCVHFPEDLASVPGGFKSCPPLNRSVMDIKNFRKPIKLPLISDILDNLFEHSDADYLIYSNVDIGLQPHFYLEVSQLIENGHDALIINRRRIKDVYDSIDQLEDMYREKGKSHPGFDCFVFHRDLYPKFELAEICIGVPFIGIAMAQNIFALSKNYKLVDDAFLTFHKGMKIFQKRAPSEFFNYNRKQFWKVMNQLEPYQDISKLPYASSSFFYRLFKWAIHPSIPIRLVAKLELKRLIKSRM